MIIHKIFQEIYIKKRNKISIIDKKANKVYNIIYALNEVREVGKIKYSKSVFRNLALISQLGFSVLTAIFLCIFIGIKLDSLFKTSYFTIIFLILGVLAGARLAYRQAVSMMKKEVEELEKEKKKNTDMNKTDVSKPKVKSRIFKE